jgi:hypothetical protein
MDSLTILLQKGEICRCLRSKTMFYETDDQQGAESSGPFWCSQTQSLIGPDGAVADLQRCRRGRSCCEAA